MDRKESKPSEPSASISSSLLDLLRRDDPRAWQRLVRVYGPLVYQWCRKAGLQPEDAADIGQEVFSSVAGSIARFRRDEPGDSFRGWICTITRNKIRDHWRRRKCEPEAFGGTAAHQRVEQVPAEPLEESVDASTPVALGALGRRALQLIKSEFSDRTWSAFCKVTIGRQPPEEVAVELGMTPNAVYLAKSRVLRRLRLEFGELLG